jgi:exodeoxyribonuclease V alpha subunit
METLSGPVERILFHNPDNGWSVFKVRVKGRRKLVTVIGHSPSLALGETIEAQGEWTEHAEHGERFAASRLETTLPRTAHAAEKYLSSGLVKGLGPELARRLVEKFGADVFDVIEGNPERLREVSGIGTSRMASLLRSWQEQKALRGIMEFLNAHGISATKAPRILRTFGPEAVEIIGRNPYRLARDVPGIGFKTADVIARHTGMPMDFEERYASAIHECMHRALARGHCAYPVDDLLEEASREVGYPPHDLVAALDAEIESGRLSEEEIEAFPGSGDTRICVAPSRIATAEIRLASNLVRLSQAFGAKPPWGSAAFLDAPPIAFAPAAQKTPSVTLSDEQRQAIKKILSSKVSLLTGGPGTGKTTLLRSVVAELSRRGWQVACCAPTGRAAQKLAEASGVEALTIHRLLGWGPEGFRHGERNPLRLDLLIVDETSMVGLELMDELIKAIPSPAALLLVGDSDQLPSVQAGRVLGSLLESGVFPHSSLREVFRHESGAGSLILRAARDVLRGLEPPLKTENPLQGFHFIEARDSASCAQTVLKLVQERIPQRFGIEPVAGIQVLCPLNKGESGARAFNRRLQSALNPEPADKIERFGTSLALGDKVIVLANDYDKDVFNGDIGRVIQIERERSSLRVDFGGRRIDFGFAELDLLSLAYAITVHKAQGSEYEAVVIPLLEESAPLLTRNLLYTAMTRGKKLVVIVGSRRALRSALQSRERTERRWSSLSRRLREQSRAMKNALSKKPDHFFVEGVGDGAGALGGEMNSGEETKV